MNRFLALAILGSSLAGGAEALAYNLPNLAGMENLSGAYLFASPHQVQWALPMSFTSDLDCSPGFSIHVTCALNIRNSFAPAAAQALSERARRGAAISVFRDIDTRIVSSVVESVSGQVADLAGSSGYQPNQTLQMDSARPYARLFFRLPKASAGVLAEDYETGDGIGTFRAELRFRTERVSEYLAMKTPEAFAEALRSSVDRPMKFAEAYLALKTAFAAREFSTWVLPPEMSAELALVQIAPLLIKRDASGGFYTISSGELKAFVANPTLVDTTEGPLSSTCVATLELKRGSAMKLDCE